MREEGRVKEESRVGKQIQLERMKEKRGVGEREIR